MAHTMGVKNGEPIPLDRLADECEACTETEPCPEHRGGDR